MPIFRQPAHPPTLLEQIAAIPRTLLPDGPAREQLLAEAHAGGPLIDVYTNRDAMTLDYNGGGPVSFIIERPLRGRSDSRWSPVEWKQWVEAGMPTAACDFCGHAPTYLPAPAYPLSEGRTPLLCFPCDAALDGSHGMSRHHVITCSQCGRMDLQLNETLGLCRDCLLGSRHAQ